MRKAWFLRQVLQKMLESTKLMVGEVLLGRGRAKHCVGALAGVVGGSVISPFCHVVSRHLS